MSIMSIRQNILLLVVLPILAVVAFSGLIVSQKWSTAGQMQRLATEGRVIASLTDLVTNLQRERGRSALYLGSKGAQYGQELAEQRRTTDSASSLFAVAAEPARIAELPSTVTKAVAEGAAALADLGKLREAVSNQSVAPRDSLKAYSEVIERLLAVSPVIVREADRNQVKNTALALSFLQRAGEAAGISGAIGAGGVAGGGFSAAQLFQLSNMEADEGEFIKLFAVYAPAEIQAAYANVANSPEATEVARLRQMFLSAKPGEPVKDVDGPQWFKAATAHVDMLLGVQEQLLKSVVVQVEGAHDQALWELIATALIVAAIVVGLMGFGVATMRSIVRPVIAMATTRRRLAAGDLDVAIPAIQRKDEIGEMARAVLVFKDEAIAKLRLESEAAAAPGAAQDDGAARQREKAD